MFCSYYGLASGIFGNFYKGQIYFENGLAVAIETGDLLTLGMTELLYGFYWNLKGDGNKAIEHSQKAIRYLEEGEESLWLGLAWSISGNGYYYLGDLDTARSHCHGGGGGHEKRYAHRRYKRAFPRHDHGLLGGAVSGHP